MSKIANHVIAKAMHDAADELVRLQNENRQLEAQRDAALALVGEWRSGERTEKLREIANSSHIKGEVADQCIHAYLNCADELAAIWARADVERGPAEGKP